MNYNVVRANHNRTALNQKTIFPSFRPPPFCLVCTAASHFNARNQNDAIRYMCVCVYITHDIIVRKWDKAVRTFIALSYDERERERQRNAKKSWDIHQGITTSSIPRTLKVYIQWLIPYGPVLDVREIKKIFPLSVTIFFVFRTCDAFELRDQIVTLIFVKRRAINTFTFYLWTLCI